MKTFLQVNLSKSLILTSEDLGKIIKSARKQQKLTQEDLAGVTGTGRRFISELEKGKETAQIGKTLLIISALGLALHVSAQWSGE